MGNEIENFICVKQEEYVESGLGEYSIAVVLDEEDGEKRIAIRGKAYQYRGLSPDEIRNTPPLFFDRDDNLIEGESILNWRGDGSEKQMFSPPMSGVVYVRNSIDSSKEDKIAFGVALAKRSSKIKPILRN